MNRHDFIASIVEKSGANGELVKKILSSAQETLVEELSKGGSVKLQAFGSFYVRSTEARTMLNPRTGKISQVHEHRVPVFRPSRILRQKLND